MPITRAAKKAQRQSLRRRTFNMKRKGKAADAVKSFKKLVLKGDKAAATKLLPALQKALDKAVKGRSLDKNAVARKKSRLMKSLKKLG